MRPLARNPLHPAAFKERYGPWAVIAGASDGTGACFAEQLASMGVNLVLIARRQEALQELGERLCAAHGVDFRALPLDLTMPDAATRMLDETAALDVGLYISNAGADGAGNSFLDNPAERAHRLVRMNVGTLIDAVHGFGGRMRARGRGGVIVMASGAGLGGQPMLAMYSATKAFELCFAESLWAELGPQGVDVVGIAAPIMNTPTLHRATAGMNFDLSMVYDPADVTHNALAALQAREPIMIVPDGPGQEKLPQVEADRKERLVAFIEWAKAYTG